MCVHVQASSPPVHALCFIKISEVFILHSSCKIDTGLLLGLQLRVCVSVQHSVCASRIFLSLRVIETRSRTCSSLFVISSYTKKAKLREPVAISLFFSVRLLINGTVQHKHKMLPERPWPTIAPFSGVQIGTIANAAASVFFPWPEPLCFFTQGQQCISALFGLHKAYPSDRSDSIHLWPCVWGCFVRRWKRRQHRETFPRRITEIDIMLGI